MSVLKVGLTGGIACGKTVVRTRLEQRGLPTLDADHVVHALLASGTTVSGKIATAFGPDVIADDGAIDRKALGHIVFLDREKRELLNHIVHPAVGEKIKEFFLHLDSQRKRLGVVDAALMVETGTYRNYHKVIVVACTPSQQLDRLMSRDGTSREEAKRRIEAQMPIDAKRGYGDFVIDTSGTLEETLEQTDRLCDELVALSEA